MRRIFLALALAGLAGSPSVRADGILIPTDRSLPPLGLAYQRINVTIDGQVAATTVEQAYRNNTDRDLEADYLFPLPPGASVRDFSMWVGGKRYHGEALDASRARQTYEDIVRRLEDPGLLECIGRDLWKMRIYPVPRRGEQKIEIRFTSILPREGDLISYQYLLRTGQAPRKTTGDFTLVVQLRSPGPLGPVYSPSHDVAIHRRGDREAIVSFERNACTLDKDFQLYFAPKAEGVGVSLLTRRESAGQQGYFLLLVSPLAEPQTRAVPRDLVLVLDTSSSMAGPKMRQARAAASAVLGSLGEVDRFALIAFGTVPTSFRAGLAEATAEHLVAARSWIDKLADNGGTDIGAALEEALKLAAEDCPGRTIQVVFLTDGLPTVGLTDPARILALVRPKDAARTRIFTFGVGDDVDAHLLDQLAEVTRGTSTYVRPSEDLEQKVASLAAKICLPVRTDLELKVSGDVRLVEIYPPRLPDLFQGGQLQVVGRYEGHGPATLTLAGRAGDRRITETYEAGFPEATPASDSDFLAPLWAQRKVGYLLDQIRLNGASAEVKNEVTRLAREFAIVTPYTSLLVVPPTPGRPQLQARRRQRPAWSQPSRGFGGGMGTAGMRGGMGGGMGGMGGGMGGMGMGGMGGGSRGGGSMTASPPRQPPSVDPGGTGLTNVPSSGKAAIDMAQRLADLKSGERAETSSETMRIVAGQKFRKITGVWVDQRYTPSAPTVRLRVLGTAFFRLMKDHPELRAILALGDRVTWVSPSGTAVVIDKQGKDDVSDAILDRLFAAVRN